MLSSDYDNPDYWKDRKFEQKHYQQALIWADFFKPAVVFDYGAGLGFLVHAFNYYGIQATGFEISRYAIENAYGLAKGNIYDRVPDVRVPLVICYDVLEHIPIDGLGKVLADLDDLADDWLLLSICMAGDPNFELDKTHVTKRTKLWWIHQFENMGFECVHTPEDFPFRNQILLFRRRK